MAHVVLPMLLMTAISISLAAAIGSESLPIAPYSSCRIVVDAGSSGTRFYVFSSPEKSVHREFLHISPGISEIAPQKAYAYMKETLYKIQKILEPEKRASCFVQIYGTAGMRLLEPSMQRDIYTQLYVDFKKDPKMLLGLEPSDLKTISGEAEAFYLAMAANYLDNRVESSLAPSNVDLYGALDLGGGSAQIVFDIKERWRFNSRRKAVAHLAPLDMEEFYLHSFLGYGSNRLQERLVFALSQKNSSNITNPCWFPRYNEYNLTGTGRATDCLIALKSIVDKENSQCPENTYCALQSQSQPPVVGSFYAVSVYYVSTLFAKDVMAVYAPQLAYEWPTPSLEEIEAAALILCNIDYTELTQHNSSHTPLEQMPRRCLDLCLVTTLLRQFGFGPNERRVVFVENIRDSPLVWATGAYLKEHSTALAAYEASVASHLSSLVEQGLPVGWYIALLMLSCSLMALYFSVHRAHNGYGTQAIQFIPDTRK
ncbi:hypothetical protein THRCLA_01975 [Thraustotheca clavata]|uniref:Ectonucleoside triphosphate diphosphohydrolase n=1 Tax=Thraustotheca clavata TaxID=74557 RepID=A0A1W0A6Y1_9STRA|nr:hypothetical protein THRCLA_01975 [Thraustotheca clavata]